MSSIMPPVLTALGFAALFLFAFIQTLSWPEATALMPRLFSGLGCLLALAAGAEYLWRRAPGRERGRAHADVGYDGMRPREVALVALRVVLWAAGFILLTLLVGFFVSVPVTVLLYLRTSRGTSWLLSILLPLLVLGIVYGVFDRLVHVAWPQTILLGAMNGP